MIADRMIGKIINAISGIATCAFALFVAALFVALPSSAAGTSGAPDRDLYFEYTGGVSHIRNQNLTGADRSGASLSGKIDPEIAFNVGAAFGKRFHKYFRAELQFSYREGQVDRLSLQGEADKASGDIGLLALMANGYVDYDLGVGVIPYVGVGIGWGLVRIEAKNKAGALQTRIDDDDAVFVWALMVGGSYPVNEAVDVSLGYRYIATTDPEIDSSVRNLGSRRLDGEFDAHEAVLGLRFNF